MPTPHIVVSCVLKARLSILAAVIGMVGVLLTFGYPLPLAATVTCLTIAGAVEVSCRLTTPILAPGVRVSVVVIVVLFVVTLIGLQYPWPVAVGLVLGTAVPATEIARRIAGCSYRLPQFPH